MILQCCPHHSRQISPWAELLIRPLERLGVNDLLFPVNLDSPSDIIPVMAERQHLMWFPHLQSSVYVAAITDHHLAITFVRHHLVSGTDPSDGGYSPVFMRVAGRFTPFAITFSV